MKSLNVLLVSLMLATPVLGHSSDANGQISEVSSSQESCESKLKREIKALKQACKNLKGQEKKTCKQSNKKDVRAKKDELKQCKRDSKNSTNFTKDFNKLSDEVIKIAKLINELGSASDQAKKQKIVKKIKKEWKKAEKLCKVFPEINGGISNVENKRVEYNWDGKRLQISMSLLSQEIQDSLNNKK